MDKQFQVQVSFMACRTCHWIMNVVGSAYFTCSNEKCEEYFKHFKIHTTVAEVPTEQALGDSIPGVQEDKEGDG